MSKEFGKDEHYILDILRKSKKFELNDSIYEVIKCDKPTCNKGEPKTDIYVLCKNIDTLEAFELKISYKKKNADFLENKISCERAQQILGENWSELIQESITPIKQEFMDKPLIYKSKKGKTKEGAITLGWKFEFLNKKSGVLSNQMNLNKKQVYDIYSGSNLSEDKKNAVIDGRVVKNSGVANYILHCDVNEIKDVEDIVDKLISLDKYVKENPKVYFGCKALNYRTFEKKYDGNRPLAVYIRWTVENNKLKSEYVFNNPLVIKGNKVADDLKKSLENLKIETTKDICDNLVYDNKIVYK